MSAAEPPRPTDAAPLVTQNTLEQVRAELWRTSTEEVPMDEQRQLIVRLLSPLEAVLVQQQRSSDKAPLNEVIAPHLPVLLGHGFPLAARAVLSTIRTEGERAALLALSEYVMDAQRDIADALEELQWRQQQKLRELCDAATDGGTERVIELAEAMRAELDTDFCNYLNMAIEQEEIRLKAAGVKPFDPPSIVGGGVPSALMAEEAEAQAAAAAANRALGLGADEAADETGGSLEWQEVVDGVARPWGALGAAAKATPASGPPKAIRPASAASASSAHASEEEWAEDEDEEDEVEGVQASGARDAGGGWRIEERPPPSWLEKGATGHADTAAHAQMPTAGGSDATPAPSAASAPGDKGPAEAVRQVEEQQWLLVLRLVRQGIYSMLAREYEDDVKHLRYIVGLSSAQARLELTQSTMLAMSAEQQRKFGATVERITANLSVQRDARDLELYTKLCEVRSHVQSYHRGFGGSGGQGDWDQV